MSNLVRLVPVDDIRPSTYNPRQADPERLELVALSLRKLGWMLPIYADAAGEILSGHQRHYVATEMLGMTEVPVAYTKPFALDERKALNIAFNRGTNDMDANTLSGDLLTAIRDSGVQELADALPDVHQSDDKALRYPILTAREVPSAPLVTANRARFSRHAKNVTRMMTQRGIDMPVIVDQAGDVVNGIGRLETAAIRGRSTVSVVQLDEQRAALARIMLNLLTMDFDLHRRYADELRYNSFRRTMHVRDTLGLGFTFAVIGAKPAKMLDVTKPAHLSAWRKVHGNKILDFGAGHLDETLLLRSVGVESTAFEPFYCTPDAYNTLDITVTRKLGKDLLEKVAAGYEWDSLFISSVLNSVPFLADRRHIVCLVSALATEKTRLYSVTKSSRHSSWQAASSGETGMSERMQGLSSFQIDYEDGMVLTDFTDKPKAQKYHTLPEFRALFDERFHTVQAAHSQANCQVIASDPRPVDPAALGAALDFEFDLAYPDGQRIGLASLARAAYEKRLGITLP